MEHDRINSDSAIDSINDDNFQRGAFAKRIASLIKNRKENNSISIGIYGKWGEGKTSVLNLIKEDLRETRFELIDFNPWLFSNEEQLLMMFFRTLAIPIQNLKDSKGEKIGKKLVEISEMVDGAGSLMGFGGVKSILKGIGDRLSEQTLQDKKRKVEEVLITEGKRLVVFLDDLDRLSSQELYSIFRLIKLTGDFKNITYVLAFDDEIVSKMLAERYSGEGYSYLEKMIQLPLKIPKAQEFLLKKYMIEQIDQLLKNNDCSFNQNERYEFESKTSKFIIPFLDNPRLVVRLVNSLSFVIPMLKREVNIQDLILVEWLKVKFPRVYFLIRDNEELFFTDYKEGDRRTYNFDKPDYTVEDFKNNLDKVLENNNSIEKKQIQLFLIQTFPKVRKAIGRNNWQDPDTFDHHVAKRICSRDHFDRYFTYTVNEGQISDVEFEKFFDKIANGNIDNDVIDFIEVNDIENLTFKLSIYAKKLKEEYYFLFSKGLAEISYKFPLNDQFFNFLGPFGTITHLVGEKLKDLPDESRLQNTIELFEISKQIEFAWEIWFILHPKKVNNGFVLTLSETEFEKLTGKLFELTIQGKTFERILDELRQRYLNELLKIWPKMNDKGLQKEAEKYINRDEETPLKFIKIFCQWTSSSSEPEPYVSSFHPLSMDNLSKVVDREVLENRLLEIYGEQEAPETHNDREPLSDTELVGVVQMFGRNYRKNSSS